MGRDGFVVTSSDCPLFWKDGQLCFDHEELMAEAKRLALDVGAKLITRVEAEVDKVSKERAGEVVTCLQVMDVKRAEAVANGAVDYLIQYRGVVLEGIYKELDGLWGGAASNFEVDYAVGVFIKGIMLEAMEKGGPDLATKVGEFIHCIQTKASYLCALNTSPLSSAIVFMLFFLKAMRKALGFENDDDLVYRNLAEVEGAGGVQ